VINLYIVVLYFFGLFGFLLFGLYAVYLTGALLFIMILFQKKLNFIGVIEVVRNLLWFVPLFLFVRAVPKDFKFTVFDELHLWAVNIKWLLLENKLQDISSVTFAINDGANQTYPPAQMLFQYFLVHNFEWSESNFLIAQIIFIFICMLAVNATFFRQNTVVSLLSFLVSFIALYLFGLPFDNILAEGFLAAQLTACVCLALKIEKKSAFLFAICLSVLALIKPISFIFVILPLLIFAARFAFSHDINSLIFNPPKALLPRIKKCWKEIFFLISLPVFVFITWQIRIRNLGVDSSVGLLSGLKMPAPETIRFVTSQYFRTFFGPLYGEDNLAGTSMSVPPVVQNLKLSLFSIIFLLALMHFMISFFEIKILRKEKMFIFLSFLLFALTYYIALLCIYISTFGEVLALVRYSVPFLFCWAMVIFYLLVSLEISTKKPLILVLIFLLVFFITPSSLVKDLKKIEPDYAKLQTRLSIEKIATKVVNTVPSNSRVYYIQQNSDGYEKTILSYLILPIDTNTNGFSIGLPYNKSDRWTTDVDLEKIFKGYDFLVLGYGDEQFWNLGKYYLNSEAQQRSQGIYKINYESGRLRLNLSKD